MSFKAVKLIINTPEGVFFEDEVLQVELKTTNGYIGLLANHAPIIGAIVPSICYIRDLKNNRVKALINSGIFSVKDNTISIITDFFDIIGDNNKNQDVIKAREEKILNALVNIESSSLKSFDLIQTKLQKEIDKLKKISNK